MELGAGIECDLRLTRDGVVLVFHDADASRMCGSPLRIAAFTAAELASLRIGEQPVPTLAGLLKLVAGHVPLLLEVKVDGDLWRWAAALRPWLSAYPGPLGVMSFDPRLVRLLKTHLPEVRRGLVIASDLSAARRWAALRLARPDFLAVDVAAIAQPWVAGARQRVPVYSWTVRTPEQRRQVTVHADAPIWEGDARP